MTDAGSATSSSEVLSMNASSSMICRDAGSMSTLWPSDSQTAVATVSADPQREKYLLTDSWRNLENRYHISMITSVRDEYKRRRPHFMAIG